VVVDSTNRRRLKVLKTPENKILIDGFNHHHFKTDAAGNVTTDPDDEEFSDVMDSLRYMGQNMFGLKKKSKDVSEADAMTERERELLTQKYQASRKNEAVYHQRSLEDHVSKVTGEDLRDSRGSSSTGGILWDFSDGFDES